MHRTIDSLKSHAHWLLRFSLASVFIYHGVVKVMDLGAFSQMVGLSTAVAVLVSLAEIAGGVGILVGAFTNDLITRLAGLAIVPVMIGAIVMVHWGRWDFMAGGMEFQVVLLLIALFFLLMGNTGLNRRF